MLNQRIIQGLGGLICGADCASGWGEKSRAMDAVKGLDLGFRDWFQGAGFAPCMNAFLAGPGAFCKFSGLARDASPY
jgi:hypothetical protein